MVFQVIGTTYVPSRKRLREKGRELAELARRGCRRGRELAEEAEEKARSYRTLEAYGNLRFGDFLPT